VVGGQVWQLATSNSLGNQRMSRYAARSVDRSCGRAVMKQGLHDAPSAMTSRALTIQACQADPHPLSPAAIAEVWLLEQSFSQRSLGMDARDRPGWDGRTAGEAWGAGIR
jgi:hypothetical protein